jgi:hypothetical protein
MQDLRHYGGHNSTAFWKHIARLPEPLRDKVHTLALMLQDVEGRVLSALRNAEYEVRQQRKRKEKAK